MPLVRDPAVLPMLDALRAVLNLDNDDRDHVEYVDPGRAEALLTGPLGGLDAGDVRRLARELRAREKARTHETARSPLPSRELLRAAVTGSGFLDGLGGPAATAPARCTTCSSVRGPSSTTGRAPSSCSGPCGPAPAGPSGCADR